MPIICRVGRLKSSPADLAAHVANAKPYTDVYRYWHGIDHSLGQVPARPMPCA